MDIAKVLVDFNLAVQYGIAIHTCAQKKVGGYKVEPPNRQF